MAKKINCGVLQKKQENAHLHKRRLWGRKTAHVYVQSRMVNGFLRVLLINPLVVYRRDPRLHLLLQHPICIER